METDSPLGMLREWIDDASARRLPDHDAMVLSTLGASGAPNARVVLCRRVDERGLAFYTNYESLKASEIHAHPHAAATFFWSPLMRQARVRGSLSKASPSDSDAYFAKRPRGHQLGAWASGQSRPIVNIDVVRKRHAELEAEYEGRPVPRPPHWGGYILSPTEIEFWVGGLDRLHSRSLYVRTSAGWELSILSP